MFVLLFAFWLILNGQWTAEIAVTGLVICGLLYAFLCAFMDYSPRREWALVRRLPRAVAYMAYLVGEVFKSGIATIRLIWSPRLVVQPEITSFHTRLKTGSGKVILGNSITMTPGTITVDVRDDLFLVHCLDEDFAQGLEGSEMEKRIMRLEEGKRHG